MRNKHKLLIDQLDKKMLVFQPVSKVQTPEKGWIHTIRTSLNMTLEQLSNRLVITKQGVRAIEEREENGSITINSLKEVGEALDLKLVYGFIPKDGSLDNLITRHAEKLASKIVLRTNQTMQLENQGIDNESIQLAVAELREELKREMHKSLWD